MLNKFRLLVIICFLLIANTVFAQINSKANFANVNINYNNKKLVVDYDLITTRSNDIFFVTIKPFLENGTRLNGITYSGDIGQLAAGKHSIIWDINKDYPELINQKIYVELSAFVKPQLHVGRIITKSILFSGLGNYELKKHKPHWLRGVITYGVAAASIFLYTQALSTYDDYLNAKTIEDKDLLFDKTQNYYMYSIIAAGGAALSWSVNIADVLIKIKKFKKHIPQPDFGKIGDKKSNISPYESISTLSNTIIINTK